MKTLAELQQERAEKVKAQSTMVTEARTAKADFTPEQETRFDGITTEIEALDKSIERTKQIDASEKRAAGLAGKSIDSSEEKEERKIKAASSVGRALRLVSSGKSLDGAEKEMNDLAIVESKRAGIEINESALLHIPMNMLRATAQTVSEDAGTYGGSLVQDNAPRVQMPFAPKGFLEQLGATRWTGLTGGAVPLPVANNYDFDWLTETGAITAQKGEFTGPALTPKRLGGAVEISRRLLAQSSINVEQAIRGLLSSGYDRAINTAAINGAGGAAPTGILNTVGVQESIVVAGAPVTRAMITELIALIEAVNSTDNSLGYLMSPALKATLQNTAVDAGSGLFLMNALKELMGYNAVSSSLVPELTGNKQLIFGDWSQLFIGEWGSMSVLSDPYSKSLNNSIQLVVNGHADVAVAQPTAFAVNRFIS